MDKEIAIETIHFSPSAYRTEQPRPRRSQEDVAWKFTHLPAASPPPRNPPQNHTRNISFEVLPAPPRKTSASARTTTTTPTAMTPSLQISSTTTRTAPRSTGRSWVSGRAGSGAGSTSRQCSWMRGESRSRIWRTSWGGAGRRRTSRSRSGSACSTRSSSLGTWWELSR